LFNESLSETPASATQHLDRLNALATPSRKEVQRHEPLGVQRLSSSATILNLFRL
jgi:hypothetical protein